MMMCDFFSCLTINSTLLIACNHPFKNVQTVIILHIYQFEVIKKIIIVVAIQPRAWLRVVLRFTVVTV